MKFNICLQHALFFDRKQLPSPNLKSILENNCLILPHFENLEHSGK